MIDLQALLQYLFDGDLLGFFQALYIASFQSMDIFYGMVTLLFTVPLYIRTKSLLLLSTLWFLVGTLFLVAMPLVGGLALLLVIFGLAGTLCKTYIALRS